MRRWLWLVPCGLVLYAASGVYFVQPDEQAVVRRFGEASDTLLAPGPHWRLPWPLDRVNRVKTAEVKRVALGPLPVADDPVGSSPSEYLTGDRNVINVQATVLFTIREPASYLFQAVDVERFVSSSAQAALTETLAGRSVDWAVTSGKREMSILVAKRLQEVVESYEMGVTIRSVDLGAVEPPADVADAFAEVISALREREQSVHQAESYASRILAEAEADCQRLLDDATAGRDRIVWQAQGDAARFQSLLAEYDKEPTLTAIRLYLDAMTQVLPRFRSKVIVDSESNIDLSIFRRETP